MNSRNIIVYDFETGGLLKAGYVPEVTQLAAVVIHPRRLEIIDKFNTEIRPLEPDKLEDKALEITRKTKEQLAKAPHPEQVFNDFKIFCDMYNSGKKPITAPIPAGYNIIGFDNPILQSYAERYKLIDKDTGRQNLMSNFMSLDLMQEVYWWTENSNDLTNIKLPTLVEEWLHKDSSGAHDALYDVTVCAELIIKFIQLKRYLYPKIAFKGPKNA